MNLGDYTVGVSRKGIDNIKDELKICLIDEAGKLLRHCPELNDVVSKIKEMWNGEDCERFLQNFAIERERTAEDIVLIKGKIDGLLDEVYSLWADFQKTNVV